MDSAGITTRRHGVLLLLACAVVAGCDQGADPAADRGREVATVGGFRMLGLPADARRECRRLASLAPGIRCPGAFPRPAEAGGGDWFIKPVKDRPGSDARTLGIEISYLPARGGGRSVDPAVIHFWVTGVPNDARLAEYGDQLPEDARALTLGGRRGIYAPPSGPEPCCNHAIFVWTEGDRRYAASLHMMGPATRRLLAMLLDQAG